MMKDSAKVFVGVLASYMYIAILFFGGMSTTTASADSPLDDSVWQADAADDGPGDYEPVMPELVDYDPSQIGNASHRESMNWDYKTGDSLNANAISDEITVESDSSWPLADTIKDYLIIGVIAVLGVCCWILYRKDDLSDHLEPAETLEDSIPKLDTESEQMPRCDTPVCLRKETRESEDPYDYYDEINMEGEIFPNGHPGRHHKR